MRIIIKERRLREVQVILRGELGGLYRRLVFRPHVQGSQVERVLSSETLNNLFQVPDLLINVVQLLLRGQGGVGQAVGGAVSPGGQVRPPVRVSAGGAPRPVPAPPHTGGHEVTLPHKGKCTRLIWFATSDGQTGEFIR